MRCARCGKTIQQIIIRKALCLERGNRPRTNFEAYLCGSCYKGAIEMLDRYVSQSIPQVFHLEQVISERNELIRQRDAMEHELMIYRHGDTRLGNGG